MLGGNLLELCGSRVLLVVTAAGVDHSCGQAIGISQSLRPGHDLVWSLTVYECLRNYLARSEFAGLGKRSNGHERSSPFYLKKAKTYHPVKPKGTAFPLRQFVLQPGQTYDSHNYPSNVNRRLQYVRTLRMAWLLPSIL